MAGQARGVDVWVHTVVVVQPVGWVQFGPRLRRTTVLRNACKCKKCYIESGISALPGVDFLTILVHIASACLFISRISTLLSFKNLQPTTSRFQRNNKELIRTSIHFPLNLPSRPASRKNNRFNHMAFEMSATKAKAMAEVQESDANKGLKFLNSLITAHEPMREFLALGLSLSSITSENSGALTHAASGSVLSIDNYGGISEAIATVSNVIAEALNDEGEETRKLLWLT
jgi:hypothetical protein